MFNYKTIDESKIEFVEIAPADELPNGERLFVEIEGKPLVIFNIAGQFFSIGDVCSHDDGPVGEATSKATILFVLDTARSSISVRDKRFNCQRWWISRPTQSEWWMG